MLKRHGHGSQFRGIPGPDSPPATYIQYIYTAEYHIYFVTSLRSIVFLLLTC